MKLRACWEFLFRAANAPFLMILRFKNGHLPKGMLPFLGLVSSKNERFSPSKRNSQQALTLLLFSLLYSFALNAQYDLDVLHQEYQDLENDILLSEEDDFWSGLDAFAAPVGFIMADNFTNFVSSSPLSYVVEGEPGSRIAKFQWKNTGFLYDETDTDIVNVQVWLYEGSQIFEIHYGAHQINDISTLYAEEPLEVGTTMDISFFDLAYGLNGDPEEPTLVIYDWETEEIPELNAFPGDGLVYRFSPEGLTPVYEPMSGLDVKIFPNPTQGNLNIESQDPIELVEITNAQGKRIQAFHHVGNEINLQSLAPGNYYLRMFSADGQITKKLVKR